MSTATKPMHEAAIRQYAKHLRLPTVGSQFTRLAEQAVKEKQSCLSYLEALLEGEVEEQPQGDDAADSGGAISGGENAGGV